LSNDQLRLELIRLKKDNEQLKENLVKYQGGDIQLVSEADIEKAKKDVGRQCLEWRKRKRACMDIVD
jgi:hypothetical protein